MKKNYYFLFYNELDYKIKGKFYIHNNIKYTYKSKYMNFNNISNFVGLILT
jgi:hypothetical protein